MVTIDQAMRGAVRFIDTEILPHLPTGKGIGAGLYNAARPKFEQRLPISIPFIGELTFDQNDVDKLYRYIKEAA